MFSELQAEFTFPNTMLFRSIQLWHALRAQFPDATPSYTRLPLTELLLGTDPAKLISTLYNIVLTPSPTKLAYRIKSKWDSDLRAIEEADWEEMSDNFKLVSPQSF